MAEELKEKLEKLMKDYADKRISKDEFEQEFSNLPQDFIFREIYGLDLEEEMKRLEREQAELTRLVRGGMSVEEAMEKCQFPKIIDVTGYIK